MVKDSALLALRLAQTCFCGTLMAAPPDMSPEATERLAASQKVKVKGPLKSRGSGWLVSRQHGLQLCIL
eukprot:2380476-Amphidinium_carterae.1